MIDTDCYKDEKRYKVQGALKESGLNSPYPLEHKAMHL
jgi:hypothetical protein